MSKGPCKWFGFPSSPAPGAQHAPCSGVRLGSSLCFPCQFPEQSSVDKWGFCSKAGALGPQSSSLQHMALMFISSSLGTRYFSPMSKHNNLTYSFIYVKGCYRSLSPSQLAACDSGRKRGRASPPMSDAGTMAAAPSRFKILPQLRQESRAEPFWRRWLWRGMCESVHLDPSLLLIFPIITLVHHISLFVCLCQLIFIHFPNL